MFENITLLFLLQIAIVQSLRKATALFIISKDVLKIALSQKSNNIRTFYLIEASV